MTPRATYRLQFREGMDFDRAASLAPYLARLGVSHLYASPLFQATEGSTHGYDVCDHGRFDESLGGMDGFVRMSEALKAERLGLILDIVPNHMAASTQNPWWRDVLRHGRESRYAGHFDIDWTAPKLLVPVLGQPYAKVLEAGEFALGRDAEGLTFRAPGHELPLDPKSWPLVLGIEDGTPKGLAALDGAELDRRLEALSQDQALLHRVHDSQPWRLSYWRAARDALTHRRFFEITDLVGVRVEEPGVFDDVHRLLFEMIEAGRVDGIRVDHVDGLADPGGYLERLAREAPRGAPIWIEKILGPGEVLPERWPVEGTTGYDFTHLVGAVLTDPAGEGPLTNAYHAFIGQAPDIRRILAEAKRAVLTWNLAAELERLTGWALKAAAEDPTARDWGPDTLRRALVAVCLAMPVYRTYLSGGGEPSDDAVLARVMESAEANDLEDPTAVGDVARLIREAPGEAGDMLRRRFEQTTGALMAKSMEDTLFYRYNRLISANEVGGEPSPIGLPAAEFVPALAARAAREPRAMNATATHDTKRGEDARMRIAAIADAPEAWAEAVAEWDAMLTRDVAHPGAERRWSFYQSLLGAWDAEDPDLPDRMVAWVIKAAREADRTTSWTDSDPVYEQVLEDFTRRALGREDFRATFEAKARPFIARGERKGLVQLALKLTAPGIPDIYQGTEFADLSLVDPDNRRPVDFAAREDARSGYDGAKRDLMRNLLALRRERPSLFAEGKIKVVTAAPGARALGFARVRGGEALLVLADLADEGADFDLPEALGPFRTLAGEPLGARVERQAFRERPVIVALAG